MVVLLLTFLCYTAYHASRKPPSIVKSVLHGDSSADENSERFLTAAACTLRSRHAFLLLANCPHALPPAMVLS